MSLLQQRIAEKIAQHGSYRAAGAVLDFDHTYLYRLANGSKTGPGDKLLRKLGLRRVVTYVDKREPQS